MLCRDVPAVSFQLSSRSPRESGWNSDRFAALFYLKTVCSLLVSPRLSEGGTSNSKNNSLKDVTFYYDATMRDKCEVGGGRQGVDWRASASRLARSRIGKVATDEIDAMEIVGSFPRLSLAASSSSGTPPPPGRGGLRLGRSRRRLTQSEIRNKGFDLSLQGLWSHLGGTLKKKGSRSGNELRGRETLKTRSADRTFRADSATSATGLACPSFPRPLSA